jgi:hypothetical protein
MSDIVLTINTNFGFTMNIDVKTTYTIEMVKCVVYGKLNMPPERQVLLIGRDRLFDRATLEDYEIYKDASVDILFLDVD